MAVNQPAQIVDSPDKQHKISIQRYFEIFLFATLGGRHDLFPPDEPSPEKRLKKAIRPEPQGICPRIQFLPLGMVPQGIYGAPPRVALRKFTDPDLLISGAVGKDPIGAYKGLVLGRVVGSFTPRKSIWAKMFRHGGCGYLR